MMDVSLELLDRPKPSEPKRSLARSACSFLFLHNKTSAVFRNVLTHIVCFITCNKRVKKQSDNLHAFYSLWLYFLFKDLTSWNLSCSSRVSPMDLSQSTWCLTPCWHMTPGTLGRVKDQVEVMVSDPTPLTVSSNLLKQAQTEHLCSWNCTTGITGGLHTDVLWGTQKSSLSHELFSNFHRSTRDSSCFTVVLNNLRVFLIFDWLQLVRDFLRGPAEKAPDGARTRQRWPSNTSTDSASGTTGATTIGAVMPKTVKSGVVTKRSTVPVTQDRYLEVKINVTGIGNWAPSLKTHKKTHVRN